MTRPATAQSFDPVERRQYLGASEIAAVMGLDRYKTPLDVFREKTGLAEPFGGNKQTERGNRLEALAADYYTEQTSIQLRRRSEAFVHPQYPFIVGHVDRVVVGEKRLVEVKCPSVAMFRKVQREGLPTSYLIQAQVYMGLASMPTLTFVIFCADVWDAAIFDIPFDEGVYTAAIAAGVKFWETHVLTGTAPEDADAAESIEIEKHGGSVTFREDEPFIAKAGALREAIKLKRDAEELFETAKKAMIDGFEGVCGIYECPGLRIYYTDTPGRKSLDKKAVAAAGIDLTPFEKQGVSFKTFKTYVLNNTQGEN